MNALSIVNKVVSLVSYKMHKARLNAVTACVKSLLNGSAATVTSIGRGISTKAFEKHRIKRADRLLSNPNESHRQLSKQVVAIYRQRMQIEEGFRDMKSTKFGLGYEQNKSVKKQRLTILVLLTTLASLVAILLGMVLVSSNKHRRFQANTETRTVLSFHYLGLRAIACRIRFTRRQWKAALECYSSLVEGAWAASL